ncbi:Cortactin-binding protein 2 [Acropora cervicornis]|uniref:Cortactin-binding protein 2 n=1 Tax=Acropora cervicornis TaxID=6130 RepID=A0AAD9QLW6_ACRCE|nr:Cortactin-binding protein 2 [Acropora cervicornis]
MANKRLFAGNERLAYFASSVERDDCKKDIATDLTADDQLMRDKKAKHRPSSVIERFLDSLKLSPKLRGKSRGTDIDCNMAKTSDGCSITTHFAPESYKHATMLTPDSRCSDTSETCDSLSDSIYSQSSDASEVRSQNTTSTDSENNRIFKQGTPSKDPKSLDNNGGPIMDEDADFLRKVVMLIKRAYDEAKALLEEQELDVNFKTPSGQSLLHIAAANADLRCVQLLLQYGANVNIKDTDGWGPLHAAVTKGNWKCAILLIEAGAEFGKYAQERIHEYYQVQQIATTFFRSLEIYV